MAKPTSTPDWINDDDPTKITEPSGSKQLEGWQSGEKPPFQYFNWFWNLISKWIQWFDEVTSQYNIIIDSAANHGDYLTLAAYLADAPAAGDRVMINLDETVTSKLTIPAGIKLKLQKGKAFQCASNISGILEFGDNCETEGDILIELSHTGTITTAVSVNGDNNHHCNIILNNTSTGTVTTGFKIESGKAGNTLAGEIINPGGTVTTPLNDASGLLSSHSNVRNTDSDIIHLGVDLPIVSGGTGAGTAGDARSNLGLGTISIQNYDNVTISGGSITGITNLAIADGGTNASTAAAAVTNLGFTATVAEINTTSDGSTAKNSHTHVLAGGATDVTASAAQVNSVAETGKYDSKGMILGDATAGRVLRRSTIVIKGVDADTINVEMVNDGYTDWNGNTVAADNIDQDETKTNYSLNLAGTFLNILTAGIGKTVIGIMASTLEFIDDGGLTVTHGYVVSDVTGGMTIRLLNNATAIDLCTIAAGKYVRIGVCYITSA